MKIDSFNIFFNISTKPCENVKSSFADNVYFAAKAVYYRQSGAGKETALFGLSERNVVCSTAQAAADWQSLVRRRGVHKCHVKTRIQNRITSSRTRIHSRIRTSSRINSKISSRTSAIKTGTRHRIGTGRTISSRILGQTTKQMANKMAECI